MMPAVLLTRLTRSLGKPRGLERLLRHILPSKSFSPNERKTIRLAGFDLTVAPASYIGWNLYCFGTYEPGLQRLINHYVDNGAVCLEIGANIGWHTLLLSRAAGIEGKVYAFEPNPSVVNELRHHLDINQAKNTTIYPIALADIPGEMFFQAPNVGASNAGDGHLVPHKSPKREQGGICVRVDTVDGLFQSIRRLDFIKIDVEGWEPAVWQGAKETLMRHRPVICMEQLPIHLARAGYEPAEATGLLRRMGYQFYSYDDRHLPRLLVSPENYEGDILCIPLGKSIP